MNSVIHICNTVDYDFIDNNSYDIEKKKSIDSVISDKYNANEIIYILVSSEVSESNTHEVMESCSSYLFLRSLRTIVESTSSIANISGASELPTGVVIHKPVKFIEEPVEVSIERPIDVILEKSTRVPNIFIKIKYWWKKHTIRNGFCKNTNSLKVNIFKGIYTSKSH